jgi:hypothetical protein
MEKHQFKIGDKVVVINAEASMCPAILNGKILTICKNKMDAKGFYLLNCSKSGFWSMRAEQFRKTCPLDEVTK